jgi:hypothetical protein
MDQQTAKRLFVWGLAWLEHEYDDPDFGHEEFDAFLATMPTAPEDLGEPDHLNASDFLDAVGEHLWGCHEVIEAPASALEMIMGGVEPGVTYQDAVRLWALSNILDSGMLIPEDERQALHAIFLKDQAGHHRPEVDQAAFHAWLRTYIDSPEEIIDADMAE